MVLITGSIFMDLLAIFVALAAIGVAYVKWCYTYWKKLGIPSPNPTFLFGNYKDLFLQKVSFGGGLTQLYNELKQKDLKFFGTYFLLRPILIVNDPELIKNMMTKDFDHFIDRGFYVNEKEDPLAANLFTLPGSKWKNLREKLTPTFTSGKMKMMFQTLVDCADGLTKLIEDFGNQSIDIKDVVGRYSTDVIGSCAFGLDCNSLQDPNTEFRIYGKKIFRPNLAGTLRQLLSLAAPRVLEMLNARVTDQHVTNFFMKTVKDTIEYRENNNVERKDFMKLLLQLKNKGKLDEEYLEDTENGTNVKAIVSDKKAAINFQQIAAHFFLFFAAGFETTSATLTFCLYELCKNISLQEKLRNEIYQVLDRHDGKITYDSINAMKYMDNVISETLRKYPPVPVLNRICTKDYKVPEMNLHIPEGQMVFIPIQAIQNDPKHYPNPKKFDPDRFTEKGQKTRHPYTWLPFGEGPRVCIGLRFGKMQFKVALAVLIKNFKFTLNNCTKEPLRMEPRSIVLSVKDGIWLNSTRIKS